MMDTRQYSPTPDGWFRRVDLRQFDRTKRFTFNGCVSAGMIYGFHIVDEKDGYAVAVNCLESDYGLAFYGPIGYHDTEGSKHYYMPLLDRSVFDFWDAVSQSYTFTTLSSLRISRQGITAWTPHNIIVRATLGHVRHKNQHLLGVCVQHGETPSRAETTGTHYIGDLPQATKKTIIHYIGALPPRFGRPIVGDESHEDRVAAAEAYLVKQVVQSCSTNMRQP